MNTKQSALHFSIATGILLATAVVPVSQAFAATTPAKTAIPLTLSTPTPAPFAGNELTITAIPPQLELNGKPGETIQKTIKVRNGSATVQYFQTSGQDFIVEGNGTTPIPVNEQVSDRFSLAKWMTVSPSQFMLRPGEAQVLDLLIQIPQDALPGGHYAMVLHQPPQSESASNTLATDAQGGSGIAQRVGTLVYLTVAGPIHEEAFIRNVVVPSFSEYGPVPVRFTVENRSDTHIRPQSSIEVKDMFGRTMDKVKVDEKNVFPFSGRQFESSFGQYWGVGRYSVEIVVPYGASGKVTSAVAYFWMFPYRLFLGFLIGVSALAAMVIAIRRHLLHRNNVEAQELELLRERVKQLEEEKK